MKAFRFTLEAVGTLRQQQEQKALDIYAKTLATRQQAVEALQAAERELNECCQKWREKLATGFEAADAVQAQAYQRALTQKRDECLSALEAAERRVNAALKNLLAARQQREVVDKFYEKQKAVFLREQARAEQRFLDDLAGRRGRSIFTWKPSETPV